MSAERLSNLYKTRCLECSDMADAQLGFVNGTWWEHGVCATCRTGWFGHPACRPWLADRIAKLESEAL